MPSRISVDRAWTAVNEASHGLTQNAETTYAVQALGTASVDVHVGTDLPDENEVHYVVLPGQIVPIRFDPATANLYVRTHAYSEQFLSIDTWPIS